MNHPNILLIVIDSARADHFSCYGYEELTTPNMDAIAAEGARFDAAYGESTWTLPQSFTLLTGLAPREHRAEAHRKLPAGIPTLPDVLKRSGYQTFAASANSFFGRRTGLHRGFDHFFMPPHVFRLTKPFFKYMAQRLGWSDAGGQALTSRFISALGELKPPWFSLIWYNDAHHPYAVKNPFPTKFTHRPLPFLRRIALYRRLRRVLNLAMTASEEDFTDINALYNGALAYVDMLIGQIRQELEQRGLWEETLVIITADHGEMLGERRLLGHGQHAEIYRPLLRLPLIIHAPELLAPQTSTDSLVQLAHVTRTLASLTGMAEALAPTAAESADLFTAAQGSGRTHAVAERDQFSARSLAHARRRNPLFNFGPHLCHMSAVVQDDWRLIQRTDGRHELYNLRDDPGEENNVIEAHPQRAAELTQLVTDWQQRLHPHPATEGLVPTIDRRVEKRLEDLGYF